MLEDSTPVPPDTSPHVTEVTQADGLASSLGRNPPAAAKAATVLALNELHVEQERDAASIELNEIGEIGRRFAAGQARAERGDAEWIEGSLEMMIAVAAARTRFKCDVEFGAWFDALGHNRLDRNDRAALRHLGSNIVEARKVLEATNSRSYRLIWDKLKNKERFPSYVRPPKSEHPAESPADARRAAEDKQIDDVLKLADFMPPAELADADEAQRDADRKADRKFVVRFAPGVRKPSDRAKLGHTVASIEDFIEVVCKFRDDDDEQNVPPDLTEQDCAEAVDSLASSIAALFALLGKIEEPSKVATAICAALPGAVKDVLLQRAVGVERAHVAAENRTLEKFAADVTATLATRENVASKYERIERLVREFNRNGDNYPTPARVRLN